KARRDVDEICANSFGGLRAVVENDATVQSALVGEGKPDGSRLDSGNAVHCGKGTRHQLTEPNGVLIACVIERGFGGHDAIGVKAGGQSLEMDEGADEEP